MSHLIDQLAQAFGDAVSGPLVQLGLRSIAAYVVVLWLAAAYWAFRDMSRRAGNDVAPFFSAALVILATPLLFPAALLVHFVVRPPETAGERVDRELRAAALALDLPKACASCGGRVARDWLACPACGTGQRHRCPACERLVELDWDVCAWCANELAPARPSVLATPIPGVASIPTTPSRPRAPGVPVGSQPAAHASGEPVPDGMAAAMSQPVAIADLRRAVADR